MTEVVHQMPEILILNRDKRREKVDKWELGSGNAVLRILW